MPPIASKKLIAQQRDRASNISRILPAFRSIQKDRVNRLVVRDRIEKLRKYWSEFCKAHEEIITREDVLEDPYITQSFFAETESIRDACNDELERVFPEIQDETSTSSALIINESDISQTHCHNVHLPKIDLPQSSGKYEEWEAFENRFNSLIHERPQLSNVIRLQFLLSCLQGPAADFVRDVAVTDANYLSTWNALKERFSNLRLQVYNLTLSSVKTAPLKEESASGLRKMVDEINHSVGMLRNLGRAVDSWDDLLVVILSERLDPITRKAWETHLSTRGMSAEVPRLDNVTLRKEPPTFREMTEFLQGTIQALHSVEVEVQPKQTSYGKRQCSSNSKNFVKAYQAGAKVKRFNNSAFNEGSSKCPLCSNEHYVGRCERFLALSASDRHGEIRRLRLCYNCLGQHRVRNCSSKRTCKRCQGSHHTLLHLEKTSTPTDVTPMSVDLLPTTKPSDNK